MDLQTLPFLQDHFAIEGEVSFRLGPGGLVFVDVSNRHGSGSIALAGAHVTSYIPRQRQPLQDVLWMSANSAFQAGKPLRGGIPICWPWFGPHPETPKDRPPHGFARTQLWRMSCAKSLPDGSTEVRLMLCSSAETHSLWPYNFELEYQVVFSKGLRVELAVCNPGPGLLQYTGALHHYFSISSISQVTVLGLEDTDYLDKVEDYARKHQLGEIRFAGQTDRVYLNTTSDCVIVDPGYDRKIWIAKEGSRTTVVWNPAEVASKMLDVGEGLQEHFVCVETANAAHDIVVVPAKGESHLVGIITVE